MGPSRCSTIVVLCEGVDVFGPEADAGGEAVDQDEGGPAGRSASRCRKGDVTYLAEFIGVLIVLMWCLPPLIGTMRCSSGVFTTAEPLDGNIDGTLGGIVLESMRFSASRSSALEEGVHESQPRPGTFDSELHQMCRQQGQPVVPRSPGRRVAVGGRTSIQEGCRSMFVCCWSGVRKLSSCGSTAPSSYGVLLGWDDDPSVWQ